jgi:hypothetical protein
MLGRAGGPPTPKSPAHSWRGPATLDGATTFGTRIPPGLERGAPKGSSIVRTGTVLGRYFRVRDQIALAKTEQCCGVCLSTLTTGGSTPWPSAAPPRDTSLMPGRNLGPHHVTFALGVGPGLEVVHGAEQVIALAPARLAGPLLQLG